MHTHIDRNIHTITQTGYTGRLAREVLKITPSQVHAAELLITIDEMKARRLKPKHMPGAGMVIGMYYTYTYIYIYIYICVCVCVCVYKYTHICTFFPLYGVEVWT